MLKALFDKTSVPFMERMLDVSSLRQRVLSSNVANAMTPGYQRRDVNFAESLKAADTTRLEALRSDERHLTFSDDSGSQGVVTQQDEAVDLEKEMSASAENQVLYQTAATLIARQFNGLKGAIRGRF